MTKLHWIIFGLVLGLAGCATQVKPDMSEQNYVKFAHLIKSIDGCIDAKQFSMEAHTASIRVLGNALNSWKYDGAKLKKMVQDAQEPITEITCNRISAIVLAEQQDLDRQASRAITSPIPVIIPQLKNTVCNRIGTQTLCNSF